MTFEVHVADDFLSGGLAVYITNKGSDGRQLLRLGGDSISWERVDPAGVAMEPTFRLPEDSGRAVLDALVRWYQGAEDLRTVRADLLHERQRREKLEDHILWLGEMSARPARPSVTASGGSGSLSGGPR